MNIQFIIILTASSIGFCNSAMESSKNIDLQRPPHMRTVSHYICNVRRCDRSNAECYLGELKDNGVLECWRYNQNGTIISTHATSFLDMNPQLINEKYFYLLQRISQINSAEQKRKNNSNP
jgi:hypothetical protein